MAEDSVGSEGRHDLRVVESDSGGPIYSTWQQSGRRWVSISKDDGTTWSEPRAMIDEISLLAGVIVPGESVPAVPKNLAAGDDLRVFLVQFQTQSLAAWRRQLRELGAEVLNYVPYNAHLVRMDPDLVSDVEAMPFVRWVGPYEPSYRTFPELLAELEGQNVLTRHYNIMTYTPGEQEKTLLAAEVEGGFLSETTGRTITFRADRLDRGPMATDYKTGKPMSGAQRPDTRKKHLLAKVKTGRLLQAVAYALATSSHEGSGRYVYLRPDIGAAPSESRIVEASADDSALTGAFNEAVEAIDACLTAGLVFPRVEEPNRKKAAHCATCQVAEACRRDDSVFRRRLVELMETEDESADEPLVAARRLWWLGVERKAKK